jgi:hypothetical protein
MTGPLLHAMCTGDPVAVALFSALVVVLVAVLAANVRGLVPPVARRRLLRARVQSPTRRTPMSVTADRRADSDDAANQGSVKPMIVIIVA